MKQFKKWLEENVHSNWTWQEDAKEAWRAALEWFSDKLDHSIEHKELKDIIDEELGDT